MGYNIFLLQLNDFRSDLPALVAAEYMMKAAATLHRRRRAPALS